VRLWHFLPNLAAYFRRAGKRIAGELRCARCGFWMTCPPERATHYLREGWPLHCGETMLLTPKEAPGAAETSGGARRKGRPRRGL
jgi:hypothetical protein